MAVSSYDKDDSLRKIDLTAMSVGIFEMSCLLIALFILLYKVCRSVRFKYVVTLICLLIVSDVAVLFLSVALYMEQTDVHNENRLALSIVIGISTFFFNMGTNIMHWLFAMKYWVIAREVPKLFVGQQIQYNERAYKIVKWIGLVINTIVCTMLGLLRGRLTY